MSTTSTTPSPADRLRATWAAGDYAAIADRHLLDIGRHIVARLGVGPRDAVLDVATGTGNAAIPAAAAGAAVTGLDLVPGLLAAAAQRAARAGVIVEWVEGDAQEIPFPDGSFDVALSTLGVQFAPDHEAAAAELARVLRPGGRIGLANWTPEGYIGRFFATLRPYLPTPPPGVSPPPLWGNEGHVRKLFEGAGLGLSFERRTIDFVHDSPAAFIDSFASEYGPLVMARRALEPGGGWDDLRDELVALSASMNADGRGRFRAPSEYLVVVGRSGSSGLRSR